MARGASAVHASRTTPTATDGGSPRAPAVTRRWRQHPAAGERRALEDLQLLREHGAEGIGLYRSEFMLSGRSLSNATEDAQYALYRDLIEQVAPQPVTIRTFDVDERQLGPRGLERPPRRAPVCAACASAWPTRTFCARSSERSSAPASHGRLRVMFPFVTGVDEVRQAKQILAAGFDGGVGCRRRRWGQWSRCRPLRWPQTCSRQRSTS